jgi:hypothetical protein
MAAMFHNVENAQTAISETQKTFLTADLDFAIESVR